MGISFGFSTGSALKYVYKGIIYCYNLGID